MQGAFRLLMGGNSLHPASVHPCIPSVTTGLAQPEGGKRPQATASCQERHRRACWVLPVRAPLGVVAGSASSRPGTGRRTRRPCQARRQPHATEVGATALPRRAVSLPERAPHPARAIHITSTPEVGTLRPLRPPDRRRSPQSRAHLHLGAPLHRLEAPDAADEVGSIGIGEKFGLERVPHARHDQGPPIGFGSAAVVFDRPADKLGLDARAVRHNGRDATQRHPSHKTCSTPIARREPESGLRQFKRLSPSTLHPSGSPALRRPSKRAGMFGATDCSHLTVSLELRRRASAKAVFASSILPSSA